MKVFKNKIELNKLKNLFFLFFLIIHLFLFIQTFNRIESNHLYFTLFSTLTLLNLFLVFYYQTFFFEKFFNVYMWLGYFFFYSIHVIYFEQKYTFGLGNFDIKNHYDLKDFFLILITFNLGVFFSFFLNRKIFDIKYANKYLKISNHLNLKRYQLLIIIIFIISLISFLNINFSFFDYYYFYASRYGFILDSFFKWFFLFGFASIMCIFLDLKESKKLIILIFLISSVQEFLFYYSILSRGSIFNSVAILFALITKNSIEHKYSLKLILSLFSLIVVLFVVNFYVLIDKRGGDNIKNFNKYRDKDLRQHIEKPNVEKQHKQVINKDTVVQNSNNEKEVDTSNQNSQNDKKNDSKSIKDSNIKNNYEYQFRGKINRLLLIVKNRIFGADTLMVVIGADNKNFDLFKKSLNEKFIPGKTSFFDKLRSNYQFEENTNNITLPGIIAFLYYTGSKIFVFLSIIVLITFCNLIEKTNILLNNNIFLSSLIGQLLAYRLWHFGYVPLNTYKFILAIILSLFIVFFIKKIFLKYKILQK